MRWWCHRGYEGGSAAGEREGEVAHRMLDALGRVLGEAGWRLREGEGEGEGERFRLRERFGLEGLRSRDASLLVLCSA